MIELFDTQLKLADRKSSKGNQLKAVQDGIWYKADYCGYEGLSEYVVSNLLAHSNIKKSEYVLYATEEIKYKNVKYLGCKSKNFLKPGEQLITLERLFASQTGESLTKSIYHIADHEERLKFIVSQTERLTGLTAFGEYMCKLLTIDALFLNEDRHMHNIAVILKPDGDYRFCPIFDNGASLLSDTTMDYPLTMDTSAAIDASHPKTFADSFDEALEIAERLYGSKLTFSFTRSDIQSLLNTEPFYAKEQKSRILEVLTDRMRKYAYLMVR